MRSRRAHARHDGLALRDRAHLRRGHAHAQHGRHARDSERERHVYGFGQREFTANRERSERFTTKNRTYEIGARWPNRNYTRVPLRVCYRVKD
jgi:hypothetical protein